MIWLLFPSGMSLVKDCSWKSYSLAEDQREDRTQGQAVGPLLKEKLALSLHQDLLWCEVPFQTFADRMCWDELLP